ncbi:hypothetical protein ACFV0T_26375 [Streptomyces sp. NPDC059582]|uniref:hypothetical protein n=1 Tax=Streptomyces sp. NPDC059582 TaxID=3346875 RepID=UPI0036C0CF16
MLQRLRRFAAVLALTAAAVTTTALAHDAADGGPQDDTTWGALDVTDDTTWGTPPAGQPTLPTASGTVTIIITPLDTTWG